MQSTRVVQVSRDPFARTTLIREVYKNSSGCNWCGSNRKSGNLFKYGTETDGGTRGWHDGLFCSKSCHDSYHQ